MKQKLFPEREAKNRKTKNLLILAAVALVCLSPWGLHGQTTLNATGGSGTISGDTYAYSIGEMVLVNTVSTSNLTVTQGLLQSNVDELETEEVNITAEGLEVYPNPVDGILFLKPALPGGGELGMKLFDLSGRMVMQQKAKFSSGQKKHLDLSGLQEGVYLLQANIRQDEKLYRHNFKILKVGN